MAVRILARTAQMLLVVFGAATLTFFVLRLAAGDPARLVNPPGTPEQIVTQVRERLGTDEPLLVQYKEFLVDLGHGDLGTSFHGEQSVRDAVLDALPNTAMLAGVSILIASILGLALGIVAALFANRSAGPADPRVRRRCPVDAQLLARRGAGARLLDRAPVVSGDRHGGPRELRPAGDDARGHADAGADPRPCASRSSRRWARITSAPHVPAGCRSGGCSSSTA